ncbi:MAG: serine/threonine protein kinase [Planctomycetales bacterium]
MAKIAVTTIADYAKTIERSRLVSRENLQRALMEFGAENPSPPADEFQAFVRFLIDSKRLTRWQAKRLLKGKHHGFFLGKYQLLSRLTSDEQNVVYLAEHTLMRRQVAIKMLSPRRLKDSSQLELFLQESQVIASLDHPNIIQAFNIDHEGDLYYMVLEYVPGKNLERMVQDQGPLHVDTAVDFAQQIAEGLDHAHGRDVVHRDVKPANLLLDESGTVKILDLGLAGLSGSSSESARRERGQLHGAADYLAPEQAVGDAKADERSDLYGLGCTLCFLLTGEPPFASDNVMDTLRKHREASPPDLTALRDEVPEDLSAIVHRLMAKDPDDRYQTAAELVEDFEAWQEEHEIDLDASRDTKRPSHAVTMPGVSSDEEDTSDEQSERLPHEPSGGFGSFITDLENESEGRLVRKEDLARVKPDPTRWLIAAGVAIGMLLLGALLWWLTLPPGG